MSLPPRGAWIEILNDASIASIPLSRSPHGERGLKFIESGGLEGGGVSLPPRGAWIEIEKWSVSDCRSDVAPPTGSVD